MNEFRCENFLSPVNPNESGFIQSKNFLRQWYIHGPIKMGEKARAAAEAGDWDAVLDVEAVPNEAGLKPDVKPVADPRDMVRDGAWMRWETHLLKTHWRFPERIIPCALLHEWYLPRHPDYPRAELPPDYTHLPLEAYTKDDTLMPYWENLNPSQTTDGNPRLAHCPRCDAALETEVKHCPDCGQRMGGYAGYSVKGWPRKHSWKPDLPDDYSFYFVAAYIKVPAEMGPIILMTGSEGRYKLFLNGREIGRYSGSNRYPRWDSDEYDVDMEEGWNLLLVKLAHDDIKDSHRFFHSKDVTRGAFLARPATPERRPVAVRNYEERYFAPERQLRITVSDPVPIGVGATARLRCFPDGTLVCSEYRSTELS